MIIADTDPRSIVRRFVNAADAPAGHVTDTFRASLVCDYADAAERGATAVQCMVREPIRGSWADPTVYAHGTVINIRRDGRALVMIEGCDTPVMVHASRIVIVPLPGE